MSAGCALTSHSGCARIDVVDSKHPQTGVVENHATREVTMTPPHVRNQGAHVPRVVVDVMLKPEILDPQGKAVLRALGRLGYGRVTNVRQGKRFELEVDGAVDDPALAEIEQAAETLLANPVIEDYAVRVEP
jgi:phosphoribosylformylglycinamidine synthase subunit PurS